MIKPQLIIDAETTHSLARLSQRDERRADVDLSAAAMLGRLHGIAAMLVQEVEISDKPADKRLQMAKDLAKLIPLLAVAERKVHKGWRGKDVEDMTDRELREARRAMKKSKA